MASLWLFLGGAIVAATVALTSQRYAQLPDRIPIHFGLAGNVDGYGPRYVAWIVVLVQLAIFPEFFLLYEVTHRPGSLAFTDTLLALCFGAQVLILNAARSGKTRVNMLGFWIFFAVMLALGILGSSRI
ncbi:MAG TPA: DUF1648 domain-containing protein [Candidatus Cybelea sp.]